MQRTYLHLDYIVNENYQREQYDNNHTERHRKQDDRDPLPFQGDGDPTAPPMAWTVIWGETYSAVIGNDYILRALQNCGYVFWDAVTLGNHGAVEMIKRHWNKWYDPNEDFPNCNRDPRDVIAEVWY
jgi:hypothetical protein